MGTLRLLLLPAAVGVAVALAPGTANAAGEVGGSCDPGPCGAWEAGDVTVTWSWTNPPANPGTPEAGECGAFDPAADPQESSQVISAEGEHAAIRCDVDYADATTSPCAATTCSGQVDVKIDKSGPLLQGYAPPAPNGSNGWFITKPVLTFTWADALSGTAGCPGSPLGYPGGDTTGASLAVGGCSDAAGNHTSGPAAFAFRYDGTPPVITGAAASRAADYGDWYNHAVSFSFVGRDDTSGMAGCSGADYSGPVDATARLEGTCTDNAGNRARGSIVFRYDDQPPATAKVFTVPANRAVDISWSAPSDAASFVLTRAPAAGAGPSAVVYRGGASHFVDTGLQNGKKYEYVLTTFDAAGNTSTSRRSAVADGSSLRPFVDSAPKSPPRLRWGRVRGARYYNVQLFKGRKKVLSAWPRGSTLQLRSRWRYGRHRYTLSAGLYRWYVWPGFGSTKRRRYGDLVGSSTFRFVKGSPTKSKLFAVPADGAIALDWAPLGDAQRFILTRAPSGGGAATTVYSGGEHDFVDEHLQNGVTYRYALTTFDALGRSTTRTLKASPAVSSVRPGIDSEVGRPPVLTWKRVPSAAHYNVQLFRGRKRVLSTWTSHAAAHMRARWRYRRHLFKLERGLYRWYVWRATGPLERHRHGALVGASTFRVTRRAG